MNESNDAMKEFLRQWAVEGMPKDKQRLAEAAWTAATNAERERCLAICRDVQATAEKQERHSRSDIEFGKSSAAELCGQRIQTG